MEDSAGKTRILQIALPNSISVDEETVKFHPTELNCFDANLKGLFFCTPKTSTAAENSYEVEETAIDETARSRSVDFSQDTSLKTSSAAENFKRPLSIVYAYDEECPGQRLNKMAVHK